MMQLSQVGRTSLLMGLFGGVLIVLGHSILGNPTLSNRSPMPFTFPDRVPLSNWQAKDSHPLTAKALNASQPMAGWQYQYQQNNLLLQVEMRYLADDESSQQPLPLLIRTFTNLPPTVLQSAETRARPNIGFYSLFSHQQMAYLSTCINPRGGSTVTSEQFQQNRNSYDLRLDRFLPWVLGKAPLRDNRCLWVLMSIPAQPTRSPSDHYPTLETAWVNWADWWQEHFPKP